MSDPTCAVPLGRLPATPAALLAFETVHETPAPYLARHQRGDWGDVEEEDWLLNDHAVHEGTRLLSAYHLTDGTKVWIITEADRSVTTVLLPSDY